MTDISSLFIDLCIFEIFASDNRTLEEAVAAHNESLFSGADDGNSSQTEQFFSAAVLQIMGAVLSQTCPGQPACSGRGTCEDSVCTCNEGNALIAGLLRRQKQHLFTGRLTCSLVVVSVSVNFSCDARPRDLQDVM